MPSAFLLRFQEPCQSIKAADDLREIQTKTKVEREADDETWGARWSHATPRAAARLTTQKTGVGREESDPAPGEAALTALPVESDPRGTQTRTRVEKGDVDYHQGDVAFNAIPTKSTKTATAVKAETTDQDQERRSRLRAIPPCC